MSFNEAMRNAISKAGGQAGLVGVPLLIAAIGEAITGLALWVDPARVVQLLFGAEIGDAGIVMCRVAGCALVALGIACWPRRGRSLAFAFGGMSAYGATVTFYLAYLGTNGEWMGTLLWPAVAVHALLIVLLARAWFRDMQTGETRERPR